MAYLEYPVHQFFDNNGDPLASGKVYTYSAGTSSNLSTYVSASGAANTNPIILDSAGRCDIWMTDGSQYKLVVKDSSDATIDTFDYVVGVSTGISALASLSADLNTNGYTIKTTASNLNIPITPHGTGQTQVKGLQLSDSMDTNGYNIEMDNATGLVDDSGNETIILGKTASAVNYVKVTNSATGSGPTIAALGDDSNVDINFEVKGSGTHNFKATTNSATKIKLYEDADNGTNTTTITTDSSIASDATVTIAAVTGTLLNSANNLSDVGTAATARTNLGLAIGTDVQAYDADLSAVAGLSSNGLIARTGSGTASVRTLTGTANQITVTNGDGVSGNPTLALPYNVELGASSTAQSSLKFFEDTDNGSNYILVQPAASITANSTLTLPEVTGTIYASNGTDVAIADGGTGQSTKTAAFDALSPVTTQGDTIYRDGSNNVRLAIGATSGMVLTSNGTIPSWALPSRVLISTNTQTGADIAFTGLTAPGSSYGGKTVRMWELVLSNVYATDNTYGVRMVVGYGSTTYLGAGAYTGWCRVDAGAGVSYVAHNTAYYILSKVSTGSSAPLNGNSGHLFMIPKNSATEYGPMWGTLIGGISNESRDVVGYLNQSSGAPTAVKLYADGINSLAGTVHLYYHLY